MLGVIELDAVNCAKALFDNWVDGAHVLVIGGSQVLGGGVIASLGEHPSHTSIIECWGVSDLVQGHWLPLVANGGLITVPTALADATRSTMERFHADGTRRIQSQRDQKLGVLDAVRALGSLR